MSKIIFMNPKSVLSMVVYQSSLQQQVMDLQQQVIELQQRVDQLTPKDPPDEEAFWHLNADGLLSSEAAASDDVSVVRRFLRWNTDFAKKYIKPHVSHKVYGETLNQMTRGLNERIAELEKSSKKRKRGSPKLRVKKEDQPRQMTLLQ